MADVTSKSPKAALEISDEISVLTFGGSMMPLLRQHRDMVVIKRVDRAFKKGDVVLYPGREGMFTLHRIMRIKKNGLIIRGDNNYFTERDIKESDIIGIMKEFYRDGKYVNCKADFKYKLYTFYICHSYYLRYLWRKILFPFLCKVKNKIFPNWHILKRK